MMDEIKDMLNHTIVCKSTDPQKTVPLLVRYRINPDLRNPINAWMTSPAFDGWAKGAFFFANGRAEEDHAELIKNPYRVMMFMAHSSDGTNTFKSLVLTEVQNRNAQDRIPDVNYIVCGMLPDEIKSVFLQRMITDLVITKTDFSSPVLLICDLYLSRPSSNSSGFYFHSDSGTSVHGKVNQAHGHENVDYLSLLYLCEPGRILRGTTIVKGGLPPQGSVLQSTSMAATNGTVLLMHDASFFHSTPHSNLTRETKADIPYQLKPDINMQETVPPVLEFMIDSEKADIENVGDRRFVRCHYASNQRYPYVPLQGGVRKGFDDQEVALLTQQQQYITDKLAQSASYTGDLNDSIHRIANSRYALGGYTRKLNKKHKKRKTRQTGGTKDDVKSFMITCKSSSFYDCTKYNTGLTIIIE